VKTLKYFVFVSIAIIIIGFIITLAMFVRPYWFSWLIVPETGLYVQKILSIYTAIMAIGTFFVAYFSFEHMSREQRRYALNEVREWAKDVAINIITLYGPPDLDEYALHPEITDKNAYKFVKTQVRDMKQIFTRLRSDSVYIERVAKIDSKLENVVKKAVNEMRGKIELLWEYDRSANKMVPKREDALKLIRCNTRLYKAVVQISEEIGNIAVK